MTLLSVTGWLVIATVAVVYAVAKLVKWSLNAEEPVVMQQHVNLVRELYKWLLMTVLVLTFGRGIAQWLIAVYHTITGAIPL